MLGLPERQTRELIAVLLVGLSVSGCGRSSHHGGARGAAGPAGAGAGGADASGTLSLPPTGDDLPLIPVGLDAYTQWAALPNLRLGERAYMRSTFDRNGGNEGADASHFIRQESDTFNVTLDTVGPGVLEFVRTNRWHGSPWHYVVDGTDQVVGESSTATPDAPVADGTFLPAALFPEPLALTWATTKGADLNLVPMPFERSLTLAYERTHYGTGYYIFHLFDPSAGNLSRPIASWQPEPPSQAALEILSHAGSDIAPRGDGVDSVAGDLDCPASSSTPLVELDGPRTLRALVFTAPKAALAGLEQARLRITWDDASDPSVDAPVPLFFGAGTLFNRSGAEFLVKALLVNIAFEADAVRLATYFPMPFSSRARIELTTGADSVNGLHFELRSLPRPEGTRGTGTFHATYTDFPAPVSEQDLVVLDTTRAEQGGSFCGNFVGMSWIFSHAANLTTLEGDPRMFFDDSESPQGQGTGTEEWAGGGDYWGGQNVTLPLAGHPTGAPDPASALNDADRIESAYRLLVADAMPFGKNARVTLEHGGTDESTEHYESVAYWYGTPGECLTLTDTLHVGDAEDERAHAYDSPTASGIDSLTSRFELGVNAPESSDTGRHMTGDSEFTLALDPANEGGVLRRKFDDAFPDQRAQVFVAADAGAPFELAGVWYSAGSNRSIESNPPGELDPASHDVRTSDRRFREDEFILPRALTRGRSSIRVRLHFTPVDEPLFPGDPLPPRAWSEFRYSAYSYVLPE